MYSLIFRLLTVIIFISTAQTSYGQYLMDMLDTTKELGRSNRDMLQRFDHIRISGYMQPQFQATTSKGAHTYSGGDFAPQSDNRFMLRRGRIRFEYARTNKENRSLLQFVFQFDGTEKGVNIRDFWGRVWENKFKTFAFTTGMFARPFGFEINYSSTVRETPERGRMSQILMRSERDLGFMISAEADKKETFINHFRLDAGLFNGQGLTASGEFDSYKDLISQLVFKPSKLTDNLFISGGVSILQGSIAQFADVNYVIGDKAGLVDFIADSSTKIGARLPRHYRGANVQLRYEHGWGNTELRGEYWKGTQTATHFNTETPGSVPTSPLNKYLPFYERPFSGGFITLLQNIVNRKNQIGIKYDWYDPNTKVAGLNIGDNNSFNEADILYGTLGFGYIWYMTDNFKTTFWYEVVKNEKTSVPGYETDISDDVFTLRLQFTF